MEQPTWIGRTLGGRYKIEDMLGQGGMSAVYKATDPNLKRVVAVKLIHAHLSSDPSFVLRFESEAAAVASLRHPNIVQVYDFNNDNGVYYMVLEFIPGETLQDRMKRLVINDRQLPLDDVLKFTTNISDAMGYAHQRGMVHRDIKPANIMLDVQGQAILMDFGIVKILGGESHTSTGAVVGTARYMPPEIIRGEVADNRSDVYSLGVTLYEMLSGRPPFMSDSAMTLMMMHLNDPVPDVRDFRSDVHPQIVAILQKCLEKNRDERYQSSAELSADLRRALAYLGGQPTYIQTKKDTVKAAQAKAEEETAHLSTSRPAPVQPAYTPPPPSSTSSPAYSAYTPPPPSSAATSASSASSSYPGVRPKASTGSSKMLWGLGAGIAALTCLVIGFFAVSLLFNLSATPEPTQPAEATQAIVVAAPPSLAAEATSTAGLPTETPTLEPTATPTGPYVLITEIRLENNIYAVDYEVYNFGDSPYHVHIFFDTVPPEQAGSPGSGPWKLTWNIYGDPPFTQYGIANRPANATQMCALVANSNHSVILESGNCVYLP